LLEVRKKTVITRQVETFTKTGIKNIIITIPEDSTKQFKDELYLKFPHIKFELLELDSELKT
jgi:choline kinase